jgi:flagellar hook-associated protein 2
MATIGLNFGAASSGTGFDVASTVTSILAIESSIETPWKTQITQLQAQDTALTGLGSNLSTLSTAVSALTNFDGVLAAKQGSSSDNSILTLSSANPTAAAGSHSVVVTSLATTSSQFSNRITNASDVLSGTLSLQVGSGTSQTITLDATDNTLGTLASAINQGAYGVSASVVTDTQGSRLSLVSKTSGAAGQITLSAGLSDQTTSSAVTFSAGQDGADAQLKVDGLVTTSASNTVTGAIPGVTFQLLQAAPSSTLQVQITNDNTAVESAMQTLVSAYNSVVSTLTKQEGKDTSGAAEPLYGSSTLALVQTQLSSALLGGATSGKVSSLSQLGVTLNQDGTLTFNQSTLDGTLNTNFSDVVGFMQNANSFGQDFAKAINGLSSTNPQAVLSLALTQNANTEADLNKDISATDARVASDKIRLTTELNSANQILQSIPSQLNEVNQIYSAISGYNQQKG